MKVKRAVILALVTIFILSIGIPVMAKPKNKHMGPIFMGEVLEVNKDNQGNTMVLAEGYIRGQKVYKETLVAIVGPDTKILNCEGKEVKNGDFAKGDIVFIKLSDRMTFSIPPQSVAIEIQVCKPAS